MLHSRFFLKRKKHKESENCEGMLWSQYTVHNLLTTQSMNNSPMRLGSVGFSLTNVGSLMYIVNALANDSG